MDAVRDNIVALQGLYPDAMVANMHRMEDLIAIHGEQVVKLESSPATRMTPRRRTSG